MNEREKIIFFVVIVLIAATVLLNWCFCWMRRKRQQTHIKRKHNSMKIWLGLIECDRNRFAPSDLIDADNLSSFRFSPFGLCVCVWDVAWDIPLPTKIECVFVCYFLTNSLLCSYVHFFLFPFRFLCSVLIFNFWAAAPVRINYCQCYCCFCYYYYSYYGSFSRPPELWKWKATEKKKSNQRK